MHVKDNSCNSPEGLQVYLKGTTTRVFFCEYSKTTPVATFEVSFSTRKKKLKERKLVERLPFLWLVYFMYKYKRLQKGQLPQEHLSLLQNLLNFIITKHLEQEVDDDLSVSVDERCPLYLSITTDKRFLNATWSKGIDVTTLTDKCLMDFNQGVVFTAQTW